MAKAAEDRAVKKLIPIIEEFLNSAKVLFVLQEQGIFDTPEGEWALSRALQALSDEAAELATK